MTAFAAIVSGQQLTEKKTNIFDRLVAKLASQSEGFKTDSVKADGIVATKLWLRHARTHGFARDAATGSWLGCIGNPSSFRTLELEPEFFAKAVLNDYLAIGKTALMSLNAPFVIIVYDGRKKSFNIVTDRVGLGHIYLAKLDGDYILSTSSLALASVISVHLDAYSLADYFLVGHLLQQRTFFREIEKIAPAAWLSIIDCCACSRRYWRPPTEEQNGRTIDEACCELAIKYRKAVSQRISNNGRTSVELTGGIDSRMNLACAAGSNKDFHTWTIAENGCAELEIVQRLRQAQDFRHYVLSALEDINQCFYDDLQIINTLTDGEGNSLNLIASPACNRQTRDIRDSSISGVGGEILRGFYYISHKGVSNHSQQVRTDRLIGLKLRPNISIETGIFSKLFPPNHSDMLKESIESYFADTSGATTFWRLDDFYFRSRQQRFAGRSCSFNNFFYRQEVPFFDNEIIDMSFRLPWQFKKNSRLVKRTLTLCHPAFAEVALLNGLPARPLILGDCWRMPGYYARLTKKIASKLTTLFIGKAPPLNDDVGIESAIVKNLVSSRTAELMDPDSMASGFLYEPAKFKKFITVNRENNFRNRVQIGLILSFELTCRYVGSSLKL